MLPVMVLVDVPTCCALIVPGFNGNDSWLVCTTEKQSPLAFGDILEGCNISLFVTLTLSPFGGPGHPLKP